MFGHFVSKSVSTLKPSYQQLLVNGPFVQAESRVESPSTLGIVAASDVEQSAKRYAPKALGKNIVNAADVSAREKGFPRRSTTVNSQQRSQVEQVRRKMVKHEAGYVCCGTVTQSRLVSIPKTQLSVLRPYITTMPSPAMSMIMLVRLDTAPHCGLQQQDRDEGGCSLMVSLRP